MKFLCFGLLFFADFQLFACSEVTIANNNVVVSARTLDLSFQPPTNIVLNPRGLSNTSPSDPAHPSLPPLQWVSRYGSVVVSGATIQPLAVVDGINEKGLSVATLWFEGATYPLPAAGNPVLAVSYLSRYILDNFATVAEAVSAIATLNIFGDVIDYFVLPVHVTLHDATGDSALIEFTSPPTPIIRPIGPPNGPAVTTNEPKYSDQVANLAHYCYFNPPVFPVTDCNPNLLPLPGDVDSESRFVRLAAFLKTLPQDNVSNTAKAIAAVFSMIDTVVEPPGSLSSPYDPTNPNEKSFPTWWIAIRDNKNLKYFLQPTQSETFYVDLKKIDFSSPKIQHRTLNLYQPGLVDDVTMLLLLGKEF